MQNNAASLEKSDECPYHIKRSQEVGLLLYL